MQDKTHSAPGNGCCGLMNPHRQSAFVGLRLVGVVPAGGKSEDLLLYNSLIIPERTLSFANFISFLL